MSWKARMPEEYTYFPKSYPLGPAPATIKKSVTPKTSIKLKRTDALSKTEANNSAPSTSRMPFTTMSGLPYTVRLKLEGKLKPEPSRRAVEGRLANYTFTYGLSKEDEDQVRAEASSHLGQSFSSYQLSRGAEEESNHSVIQSRSIASAKTSTISERLKSIKASFNNAAQLPNQPKPYFRNWTNSKSSGLLAKQAVDSEDPDSIVDSTQNILLQTGLHEGLHSYFDALESMDKVEDDDDGELPMIELGKAAAAFQPPSPKPSRLQPKTYYEVGNSKTLESRTKSNLSKSKSTLSAAASSVTKKSSKRVRLSEEDPTIFIKSPPLKPSHREKLIEKQLQKEVARTPMTHDEYSHRKQELLQAAMLAYDRDVPTYEVMPDIRDEVMAAEEQSNAVSRQNVMDLLYNALTNQSTTLTMKSPSISLHLSRPQFTPREKSVRPRPLDQFNGPVVSTILRELEEAKDSGVISSQEFAPINSSRFTRHVPVRKESKEKLKALRALENYDLSKLRERNAIAPKPVLTILSVKKGQGNLVSKYSGVGGTKKPKEEAGTTTTGAVSLTALSTLQTRHEKYNIGRMRPVRKNTRNPKPLLNNNISNKRH